MVNQYVWLFFECFYVRNTSNSICSTSFLNANFRWHDWIGTNHMNWITNKKTYIRLYVHTIGLRNVYIPSWCDTCYGHKNVLMSFVSMVLATVSQTFSRSIYWRTSIEYIRTSVRTYIVTRLFRSIWGRATGFVTTSPQLTWVSWPTN